MVVWQSTKVAFSGLNLLLFGYQVPRLSPMQTFYAISVPLFVP